MPSFREWSDWAEEFALGELALLPDQFWALTYREFYLMHRGFVRRENRDKRRMAEQALLTDGEKYPKNKRSADRLLGWTGPDPVPLYPIKKWLVLK